LKLSFFEIQNLNCSNKSDGEMIKIKFLDLDKFYKFIAYDFLIWNHFLYINSVVVLIFWNSKFKLFKKTHMEKSPKPKL
jgi:hypothetical protein